MSDVLTPLPTAILDEIRAIRDSGDNYFRAYELVLPFLESGSDQFFSSSRHQ